MAQVAVAIVSDHRLLSEGLLKVLSRESTLPHGGIIVAGTEGSIILLDAAMEGALAHCAAMAREGKAVIVLGESDDEWGAAALRAGARGVLDRDAGFDRLLEAIQAVAEGQVWADKRVVARALSRLSSLSALGDGDGHLAAAPLTPREREIVGHIVDGLCNKEIAGRMAISQATVKAHLTSVFRKMSVRDRTQLVVLYHQPHSPSPGRPGRRVAARHLRA